MFTRRVVLTLIAAALLAAPATAGAIPTTTGGDPWFPNGEPPIAAFTAPSASLVGQAVALDASASEDPDGVIVRYEWDFDSNGAYDQSSTNPHVTHMFNAYLNFTVRLRVTDNRGNKSTTSRVIVVHPPPRARFFVAPTQPTAGRAAMLVAKDSYGSGGRETYEWDLDGNGSYETSDGQRPEHRVTFTTAGQHTVGLRVTDRYGVSDTASLTFTVKRARPIDGISTTNAGVLSRK